MTQLPIPIPSGYKVLVSVDQKISQGEVIASSESSPKDLIIEVAKDLEIDPSKAGKCLVKNPGDRIEAGGILAKKGGVMGSREVRSKVGGTVVGYDQATGELTIRTSDNNENPQENQGGITSPVDGTVLVCDNEKVVIGTEKEAILATEGTGASIFGEIFLFEKDEVEPHEIDDKVEGKILIGKTIDREAVAKAIGLKVLGIVGQNIDNTVFENLREKKIGTPVLKVDEENYKKLHKKTGKLMLDPDNKLIVKI